MQTRTFRLAAALLTLTPAAWAQAPAAPNAANTQTYTLRYKFKTGDVGYYKATIDTNGTVGGGPNGQSFPLQQHLVLVYHQAVTGVGADGAATVVKKFDSIAMTMNGQPLPNADAMTEQMKSRTFTMTVSPTGKPSAVKIDGPDGGAMPGMDFSKMANFQGAAELPANPVKIGDAWNGTVDINGAFGPQMTGMQATVASTLAGVDSAAGTTIANISQVTKATFDSTSLSGMAAGMSAAGGLTGTGMLKFDAGAGVVVSQTSNSTLDMTLTPQAGAANGLTGPMHIQFQISTDLEKLAGAPAATPAVSPASFTKPGPDGSYLYGRVF